MLCSLYLRGVETRFNPNEQNDDGGDDRNVGGLSIFSQKVRSFGGRKFILLPKKEVDRAHWFVLHNYDKVQPYLIEHMEELKLKSNENLCQRQEQEFPKWFENRIYGLREMGSLEATNDLHYLSCKPDVRDHTYNGCIINGVCFQTKVCDDNCTTQNSGIFVSGEHSDCSHDYYGVLEIVLELTYTNCNKVFLFKCLWFNTNSTHKDPKKRKIHQDYHLSSINVNSLWYKDDLYILVEQAQQVVYVNDYKLGSSWKVMQRVQCRNLWDVPENEVAEEVDEDIEPTTDNHVYQEDEFNEVHWAVQGDQESLLSSDDDMDEDSEEKPHVYVVEIDPTYRNITMEGKRKRIRVAVVIPSSNTQGSANDMPFYFECYLYYVA
ncbi:hypothetical protein FF1_014869 [Malus domestica]